MSRLPGVGGTLELLLGLRRNPFVESSLLGMESPLSLLVETEIDPPLYSYVEDALSGMGSAFVAITGPPGSGRSFRLACIAQRCGEEGARHILYEVNPLEGPDAIDDLLNLAYLESRSVKKKLRKLILGESDLSEEELERLRTSPAEAGEALVDFLSSVKPVALLLDDVQNALMEGGRWSFFFFEMIRELVSLMGDGMFVAMTTSDEAFSYLERKHPALVSRLHERISLGPLSDDLAIQLVSKRLESARSREPEWPLDPVEEEAVRAANAAAQGNPKRLLEILAKAVDAAAILGRTRITEEIIDQVVSADAPLLRLLERVPPRLRRDVWALVKKFDGGPVEIRRVATEVEIPTSLEYPRLESLVAMGVLAKDKSGRYYVPRRVLEAPPDATGEGREEERLERRIGPPGGRKVSKSFLRLLRKRRGV